MFLRRPPLESQILIMSMSYGNECIEQVVFAQSESGLRQPMARLGKLCPRVTCIRVQIRGYTSSSCFISEKFIFLLRFELYTCDRIQLFIYMFFNNKRFLVHTSKMQATINF